MPPKPPQHLSASIVLRLASVLQIEDGAFVVGGQALNLWAERYANRAPELAEFGPYTSKDLDYFGHRQAAQKLADALDGKVLVPTLDSASPNSALVVATIDGVRVEIDFVLNVIGVRDPTRAVVEILVPIKTDAGDGELAIPVMHPLHCLQSRVANILTLRRADDTAKRQLVAAPIVLREYISEMLGIGDHREATDTLVALFKYLRSDTTGRNAHCAHPDCDPALLLDRFLADERLDRRFRQFNLSAMRAELSRRRAVHAPGQPRPGPGAGENDG